MKTFLQIIGLLFLLTTCNKKSDNSYCNYPLENPSDISETEYQIINTVINTYYGFSTEKVRLSQVTCPFLSESSESLELHLESENVELDAETLQSYIEANISNVQFDESKIYPSVNLISKQEIDCIFSKDIGGWEAYYNKYPKSGGYIVFSIPGVNSNCDEAILEYAIYRHYLAAAWYIVVLKKVNSNWIITNQIITLVS